MASKSKWLTHFNCTDQRSCKCNLCAKEIVAEYGNTSNLRAHFQRKHRKEFVEIKKEIEIEEASCSTKKRRSASLATAQEQSEDDAPTSMKQLKFTQFTSAVKWDRIDPRQRTADQHLADMICMDFQPMSIVEDRGFVKFVNSLQPAYKIPTRRELRSVKIPGMYEDVKGEIKEALLDVNSVALTTDHWTSRANDAYMALTCHFLTSSFEPKDYCLTVAHTSESHTAQNISHDIIQSVEKWLPNKTVKLYIISDNASNMVAAGKLLPANFTTLFCFAHTLQLVIKDSIKKYPSTQNVIAKCKNIVSHFHHSTQSSNKLKEMQTTMGLTQHKLKSECETRWNSTYFMLERMVDQKEPLSAVIASIQKVQNLSAFEWKTASEYVEALRPLEHATTILSSSKYATISMIIPVLNTIIEQLEQSELDNFAKTVISNIKTRWPDYESNKLYVVTTTLDPRFKLHAFSSEKLKCDSKKILLDELFTFTEQTLAKETVTPSAAESDQPSVVKPTPQESVASTSSEGGSQKETSTKHDFWASLKKKVAKTCTKKVESLDETRSSIKFETERFLEETPIEPSDSPFKWWSKNKNTYPHLAGLAKSLLFIPGTSVPSERIFSKAGLVLSDRRCRLKLNHAEMLVFLNHNLKQ